MSNKAKNKELKIIGLKLRAIREAQGVSRAQLAFELDTTEKQITRIEYGEINTGIMSIIKIAKILEVDPKVFFEDL